MPGVYRAPLDSPPRPLNEMLEGSDRAVAGRAMEAMLRMVKIDLQQLREAYEGVPA